MADKIVLAACCLHNVLCDDDTLEPEVETLHLLHLPTSALQRMEPLKRNSTEAAF